MALFGRLARHGAAACCWAEGAFRGFLSGMMYSCSLAGNFEHLHDYSCETKKVWVISHGTSSLMQCRHVSQKQRLPLVDLLVLPLASTSLHGDLCNGDPALDRSSSISCIGTWAIISHTAQRKWDKDLQSEAPVAPNGTGFNGKATFSQGSMRLHLLIFICNVCDTWLQCVKHERMLTLNLVGASHF